jgi:hypothetical protein
MVSESITVKKEDRMKRVLGFFLLVMVAFLVIQASCEKKVKSFSEVPVQKVKFSDYVFFHNIGITYMAGRYYTMNGGNAFHSKLNEYDSKGVFVKSYDVGLDGRSIFYNPKDKSLYVKVYGTDLYKIDLKKEDATLKLSYIFETDNSSPAISPDGKFIYEFAWGKVRVLDSETGKEVRNFWVDAYHNEHGYGVAIAAMKDYLFIWGETDVVFVYDLEGKFVAELNMPREGYGFSLSYCNGMLWFSEDGNGSTVGGYGYW